MHDIHEIWPPPLTSHGPKPATKQDLHKLGHVLLTVLQAAFAHIERHNMTNSEAIKAFADQQTAFQTRVDANIAGLQADVQNLEEQITTLQNTPGQITPEDQALLDGIQAKSAAIADKLDALDALTPPKAPPVEPPANPV